MRAVTPSREQILALQQRERSYYYSKAVEVLLRKLGFIVGDDGAQIVTRLSEWSSQLETHYFVAEGCLSESLASRWDVDVRQRRAKRLELVDEDDNALGSLLYHRALVRRIPSDRSEVSEPYPFQCADPLWNAGELDYQVLDGRDAEPILFAHSERGRETVGVRSGSNIFLGVPLVDVLVQQHTTPPYDVGYYSMIEHSDLRGAEDWLVARMLEIEPEARRPVWPEPYRAALTIRHDYDRPISGEDVESLLRLYKPGLKSTWFWRVMRADAGQVAAVIDAGHEVALHTEAATEADFRAEIAALEDGLGLRALGFSAHGGIPAPGYLGLKQIDWAIAAGLRYGERLARRFDDLAGGNALPHEAIVVRNGVPAASSLVLPAQHHGLDVTTAPDGHRLDPLRIEVVDAIERGEHCVIMNHPDIHREQLVALLTELDLSGVWCATLAEIADWFVTRSRL